MSRAVSPRSIFVAVALAAAACGTAQARDEGYRGLYVFPHTDQMEQRSGVRLQGHRQVVRDDRAIPDYRVVRGVFDDERRYDPREDDAGWRRYDGYRRAPAGVIVGSGRYRGNANAWYRSGAGSYFTITNYDEDPGYRAIGQFPERMRTEHTRVINVDRGASRRNDSACSFEAGVCVIRGR